MKKVALMMALVGMASADTLTFDVTRDDNDVQFQFGEGVDSALSLTYVNWEYAGAGNCEEGAWQSPDNSNYQNTFSPSAQLRAGTDDCWTLNFTVTNNGSETLNLSQFTFDVYGINGGGSDKSGAPIVEMTLDGGSSGSVILGIQGNTATATLDMTGLTLSANQTISLALTMGNDQLFNTYSGIKSGSVTYSVATIPEPTTATLSLLALGCLALRRRK